MTSNTYPCNEATSLQSADSFDPYCESDSPDPEMVATIEAAIENFKRIRFQLEQQGSLTGLQQLEDAMLSELDLLESTKWGVSHTRVSHIFANSL